MKASPPPFQAERLSALRDLRILDTPREEEFDEIVELASRICDAPISVINLIDEHRQWFKAETGLGVRETPLDTSICAHVILEPDLTVIPDTLEDPRVADNPLCFGEPHLRFYAGALLKTEQGHPIGTLCVLDHKPRELDDLQKFALKVLARQVMSQIRLRRLAATQSAARLVADEEAARLREAARMHDVMVREVDHRVKNSLSTVAAILSLQSRDATSEEASQFISTARDRVLAISAIHEQIHGAASHDKVDVAAFVERLLVSMNQSVPPNVKIREDTEPGLFDTRMAGPFGIIVNELVANSVKHAFPDGREGEIVVACRWTDTHLILDYSDDGVGMPDPSGTAPAGTGHGLGMRVVRASVRQLGGEMEQPDMPRGFRMTITLPVGAG